MNARVLRRLSKSQVQFGVIREAERRCPNTRNQKPSNTWPGMFWVRGELGELELQLIQTQMTQKLMLRAEVGMRGICG